jgi:hypothetical protein
MKTDFVPSELVVAHALRSHLPDFLLDTSSERELKEFGLFVGMRADGREA